MENYLLETREIGDYRINIYQDYCPSCPCTDWDMLGIHLFNYSDSDRLSSACNGDEVSATSLKGSLSELVCQYVPQKRVTGYINEYLRDLRVIYDRSEHMWYLEEYNYFLKTWSVALSLTPDEMKSGDYVDDFMEYLDPDDLIWLLHNCQRKIAFHDWSSSGCSQGDCVDGISFCTRERFAERYGKPGKDWRERAVKCMEGEAESIDKWLCGDVIGYTLEHKVGYKKVYHDISRQPEDSEEWEKVDSCWGYYCGPDELISDVISEHGIQPKDAA